MHGGFETNILRDGSPGVTRILFSMTHLPFINSLSEEITIVLAVSMKEVSRSKFCSDSPCWVRNLSLLGVYHLESLKEWTRNRTRSQRWLDISIYQGQHIVIEGDGRWQNDTMYNPGHMLGKTIVKFQYLSSKL